MARAALVALVALAASRSSTAFTTTLHGGTNEDTPVGTPGVHPFGRQSFRTMHSLLQFHQSSTY